MLDIVDEWQARFRAALGRRLVYAVRRVLPARRAPVPGRSTDYDELPQHENGIGMARAFAAEVRGRRSPATTSTAHGTRTGLLRVGRRRARRGLPRAARARPLAVAAPRPSTPTLRRSPSSPASTARGCSSRSSADLADAAGRRVAPAPGRRTASSAATSRSPACSPAPTSPARSTRHRLRRRARPAARRRALERRFLDGTTPDDLPRPVEVVATDGASLRARRCACS